MAQIQVDLAIDADAYQMHYRYPGVFVQARARDGRSIRFPARLLQPFVRRDGIHGRFVIDHADGRCLGIRRVAD